MLDFRTVNSLWCSLLAETLVRLGLQTAVLCPGSRSGPLTLALARHRQIESLPILDERSASFFALGRAKRTQRAVVLVCTSGTAAANFFPAIIEAQKSQVPLLVLTGDRPPELRHCQAGQTIDQVKLYGTYPQWQAELALPAVDGDSLGYLRQILSYAWEKAHWPRPGVVHLNCPFREPLAPTLATPPQDLCSPPEPAHFWAMTAPFRPPSPPSSPLPGISWSSPGLILVGLCNSGTPQSQAQAIAALAQRLHYPVLADALSPLRNFYTGDYPLITGYDFILRSQSWGGQLRPAIVIQVGELPTSKTLRAWLTAGDVPVYVLDPSGDNLDARQGRSQFLRLTLLELLRALPPQCLNEKQKNYNKLWLNSELMVQNQIRQALTAIPPLQVSHLVAQLPALLPAQSLIMVANSMPVRYMEYFWPPNQKGFIPYVNRGVNGIDGTLSTALGLAHRDRPTFLLTGDLSFLHDSNGLLIAPFFRGNLTIVLLNNQGGGIFELLPVAESTEPEIFELYFATPQQVNFAFLCRSYGVHYEKITTLPHLTSLLEARPALGVQVWEVPGDRRLEAQWLKDLYLQFAVF